MAAAIKALSPLDREIEQQKQTLQMLQVQTQGFIASFPTLPPKDRAKKLIETNKAINSILQFLDKAKAQPITNAGSRFSLDNLRNSFQTFVVRWRKFEKSLDQSAD